MGAVVVNQSTCLFTSQQCCTLTSQLRGHQTILSLVITPTAGQGDGGDRQAAAHGQPGQVRAAVTRRGVHLHALPTPLLQVRE